MRLIERVGQQFGKFTVIARAPSKSGQTRWLCRCECGNEIAVQAQNLTRGRTQSCGCWRHGMANSPTYSSWSAMVSRCHCKTNTNYPAYGARGISVCNRWRHSFAAFLEDMGQRPSLNHSIDRIDNDGNYEPKNCRWATRSEQRKNQRPNIRGRKITFRGECRSIRSWAKKLGLSERTLGYRVRTWPVEKALTTPLSLGRSRGGRASQQAQSRRA